MLREADPTRIALELREVSIFSQADDERCACCDKPRATAAFRPDAQDSDDSDDSEDWVDDDDAMIASMMAARMAQMQSQAQQLGTVEDASEEDLQQLLRQQQGRLVVFYHDCLSCESVELNRYLEGIAAEAEQSVR